MGSHGDLLLAGVHVTCPWHGRQYDVTPGTVVQDPGVAVRLGEYMEPPRLGDVADLSDREASALDNPLNGSYVRVLIIEAVVVLLLFVLGRMFR